MQWSKHIFFCTDKKGGFLSRCQYIRNYIFKDKLHLPKFSLSPNKIRVHRFKDRFSRSQLYIIPAIRYGDYAQVAVNTYGYTYPSSDALHTFVSRTQRQKTLYTCLVSLTCATCVAHIILRYVIILIIFLGNKTMKILRKEAPVSSFYFLPLRSQCSPPHPFNSNPHCY